MTMPPRRVWLTGLLLLLLAGIAVRIAGGERGAPAGVALADPCVEPLRWRTGDVDTRFGLTAAEFQEAVRAAVDVWERSTGRTLFRHDPAAGMPINLVYDHRQAQLERRVARRDRLRAMDANIGGLQDRHNRVVANLSSRLRRYNADVARWNRRGGNEAERGRLAREQKEIERLRVEADHTAGALREAVQELEDSIRAFGSDAELRVQTGAFEETVVERLGREFRTVPRLTIFQFEHRDELVLVLTHELGHALGIGHLPEPDAIMAEEYRSVLAIGDLSLTAADVGALLARCGIAGPAALGASGR